jgi:hypothetical protein
LRWSPLGNEFPHSGIAQNPSTVEAHQANTDWQLIKYRGKLHI